MSDAGRTGWALVAVPTILMLYAYAIYPAMLSGLARLRRRPLPNGDPSVWPRLSISLPVYNEAPILGETLRALIALDYPTDRREILVISDASTDGTDAIVASFRDQGVRLLRMPERGGKTRAENAGAALLNGEIVVNTDASTRLQTDALKAIVRVFQDPSIGTASGCDRAIGATREGTSSEASYTSYELWLRSMETDVESIVGSSGCFYAIRAPLHRTRLPEHLSRDFSSALLARDAGLRAVSVPDARCTVPIAASLRVEFRRKIRTMARGLVTLWYWRRLLHPLQEGLFAWCLGSHKLARWLVFLTAPFAVLGLLLVATTSWIGIALLAMVVACAFAGTLAVRWRRVHRPPRMVAFCGTITVAFVAGWLAWMQALRGVSHAVWEPTQRA